MPIALSYFKSHPLRVAKDQSKVLIKTVRASEKATIHPTSIHPTAGAFIHYGGVELADMLTITAPSLSDADLKKLTQLWYASCGVVAKQLIFYTWQIITKELRHGSAKMSDKAFESGKWDPEIVQACKDITKGGSYMKHVDGIGHKPVGLYVSAVEQHFRHGGWQGAYGGKKWADIALVVKQYIDGTSSAMLAADRAWTLMHNTGPIFNKGFYFLMHDSKLLKVLDAQASSSVFKYEDEIISNPSYSHNVLVNFQKFTLKAVAAIQQVKPGYLAGDGGSIGSDGSKPVGNGSFGASGKPGQITKHLGPIPFVTSTERPS